MKKFKVFDISTTPFVPEIISGMLWELNFSGIDEREDRILAYCGQNEDIAYNEVERILSNIKNESIINEFSIEETFIGGKNWNEEWEKNLQVIHVGNVVIVPSFKQYKPKKGETIITIDPKMSFGTGEHESTRLMLSLMRNYVKQGQAVLDVGSGTGILAIYAAKLGAQKVTGIDNNDWCYENGQENIKINKVESIVEIKEAEIYQVDSEEYDLIVANINKIILLDIAEELESRLKKHGVLILSGILRTDKDDIVTKYENIGLQLVDSEELNDWIALVFK